MSFMVTTTDGVRAADNTNKGIDDEASANSDAARRNETASKLGIKTRYEVRPFVKAEKVDA